MISPWIHPITKAKIRIIRSKEDAVKQMKEDGVDMDVIPEFLGGRSKGLDCGKLIQAVIQASGGVKDPRLSWPEHEKKSLAPVIVKRRGYHNSVYSSDATPFVRVSGWLEKRGDDGYILSGSWIRRWFVTNNEYLNYYDQEEGELLGSYNLKKMKQVEKTKKGEFTMFFKGHKGDDGGEEKRFRLVRNEDGTSDGDVDQWIKDLRERKEWFSDIWDATESEFKLNDEKKKQKETEDMNKQEAEEKERLKKRRAQAKQGKNKSNKSKICGGRTNAMWIGAAVVMVSAAVWGILSSNGM